MINKYSAKEFEMMSKAGLLAAQALEYVCSFIKPGITTDFLDQKFVEFLGNTRGKAACLNYYGFPKHLCVSVNEVICHGIPDDLIIKEGDLISVDLVVELDGYHGDTCKTVIVGETSARNKLLVEKTYEAMMNAIEYIKPGMLVSEIGRKIQETVYPYGFDVVKNYCGHGIGKSMHEEPQILHINHSTHVKIEEGMCFTIEPMITAGKQDSITDKDEWTVRTKDRSMCAQFEHTIGMTSTGAKIFTKLI